MEVIKTALEYTDDDGTVFEGILCRPKAVPTSQKLPGVLVHHAFGGCSDFEAGRAEELAKLGYIALAADVYGKGKRGKTIEENFALLNPLRQDRTGLLKRRLFSSLNALKTVEGVDAEKIAAIGYCFGGMCAMDLARYHSGIKAAVSYHGTLTPIEGLPNEKISATIQVHHGDKDAHIAPTVDDFMKEMREREADFSFTSYANAHHGFTEPHADKLNLPSLAYNREADLRSWAATVALFAEIF